MKNKIIPPFVALCFTVFQGCSVHVNTESPATETLNDNVKINYECKEKNTTLNDRDSTIYLEGTCTNIHIKGVNNTIYMNNADLVKISGANNVLHGHALNNIEISGVSNKLMTDSIEKIEISGVDNDIVTTVAKHILSAGVNNTVHVEKTDFIAMSGVSSEVYYGDTFTPSTEVKITSKGVGNSIVKKTS